MRPRNPTVLVEDRALSMRVERMVSELGVRETMRRLAIGAERLQDARSGTMRMETRMRVLAALEAKDP